MRPLIGTLMLISAFAPGALSAIVGVPLGSVAPPSTIGPNQMTPFPPEPTPYFTFTTAVPSPLGGEVHFTTPLQHFKAGSPGGIGPWGHGNTGDVYFLNVNPAPAMVTMTLPPQTMAFCFYAMPIGGIMKLSQNSCGTGL